MPDTEHITGKEDKNYSADKIYHKVVMKQRMVPDNPRPSLAGSVRFMCPCCNKWLFLEIDQTIAFDVIDTPIAALELNTRTITQLHRIKDDMTVMDLIGISRNDLLVVPGIGMRTVNEIIDCLSKFNLKLREE